MRRTSHLFVILVVFAAAAILVACGKDKPAGVQETKGISHYFPIRVGDKVVRMQLAVYDSEQERGLMGRTDLGTDDGMLFVYAKPQQMHFWMHNTPTALDIGFFDDRGVLIEIYPMQPFDETTVSSRSNRVKFPLEMRQGWFRENGVKPGAQLDLKALGEALKERGFDPRKFVTDAEAPK